jgi:hypothetical protein
MTIPRFSQTTLLNAMLAIALINAALVPILAWSYSYDTRSELESGLGFAILAATAWFVWFYRKRLKQRGDPLVPGDATLVGIIAGLLWVIEISINNFIAPPLPLRDRIDDSFWAVIALLILGLATVSAYQSGSLLRGLKDGAWSGLVSGMLACWAALALIVFGMGLITRDSINIAEWADRGAGTHAPSMAAYFAFETFAGALLHLVVLGLVMGSLLGIIGGILGKSAAQVRRPRQAA